MRRDIIGIFLRRDYLLFRGNNLVGSRRQAPGTMSNAKSPDNAAFSELPGGNLSDRYPAKGPTEYSSIDPLMGATARRAGSGKPFHRRLI
jgi:hypothetical protein